MDAAAVHKDLPDVPVITKGDDLLEHILPSRPFSHQESLSHLSGLLNLVQDGVQFLRDSSPTHKQE